MEMNNWKNAAKSRSNEDNGEYSEFKAGKRYEKSTKNVTGERVRKR